MAEIYLSLDGEFFENEKEKATKKAILDYGEETKDMLFDKISWSENEPTIEFDSGRLHVFGSCELGYLDITTDLCLDLVVDIIEYYMKKLGKLKTVLEATK